MLQSLIMMGEFDRLEKLENLTREILSKWIRNTDTTKKIELTKEGIDAAVIKAMKINVDKADPKLRIVELFSDYTTFLRNQKRENVIEKNPKVVVEHICGLLRP